MMPVPKALAEAITLHRVHMVKPATATMASQKKLMDLLEEARDELQGGGGMKKDHDADFLRKMGR